MDDIHLQSGKRYFQPSKLKLVLLFLKFSRKEYDFNVQWSEDLIRNYYKVQGSMHRLDRVGRRFLVFIGPDMDRSEILNFVPRTNRIRFVDP